MTPQRLLNNEALQPKPNVGEKQRCRNISRSVNHGREDETVPGCEKKSLCPVCSSVQAPLFGRGNPRLENMVMLVGEGYNELACFRGCAASLRHQSQEHGKANTELISKTSKGGPLPAKNHSHLSFCLLPLSLPLSLFLSAAPPSLSPLRLPSIPSSSLTPSLRCENFFSSLKKKKERKKKNWNQLRHRSSLLFWPVPGVKAPGIVSVVLFRNSAGPPCQGTGVILHT